MRNAIYHKGRYRSREWVKHLRPFLKRKGNKRWRKDARLDILDATDETRLCVDTPTLGKKRKSIKVKFTIEDNGFKHSYYAFYSSFKTAEDAIKRPRVIRATIFTRKGTIIRSHEKYNTGQTATHSGRT